MMAYEHMRFSTSRVAATMQIQLFAACRALVSLECDVLQQQDEIAVVGASNFSQHSGQCRLNEKSWASS